MLAMGLLGVACIAAIALLGVIPAARADIVTTCPATCQDVVCNYYLDANFNEDIPIAANSTDSPGNCLAGANRVPGNSALTVGHIPSRDLCACQTFCTTFTSSTLPRVGSFSGA